MKKILITALIAMCAYAGAQAQSNVTVSYPISFGSGDLGTFVGKTSWRGFSFDYRYMVKPNLAVGLHSSWTTFYEEKGKASYTRGNETLYGQQFRYSNNVPITATFAYFKNPDGPVNPFFSLGIGTMYTRRNTDMNLYTLEQEAWNFLLQPEIGAQFQLQEGVAFTLSGRYNHGFKAGSQLTEPQSYFTLNVGFSFY